MSQLLLAPDTRVTCPKCAHEFVLAEGFARKALESAEAASSGALASLREEERARAEREAALVARERDAAHEKTLAQVRQLADDSNKPQLDALRAQLAERDTKLATLEQREAAIATREKAIEARVTEAAAARAAELIAGERQAYEKRLSEQSGQLQTLRAEQVALREERQKLKDEKDGLALEVQRQLDAKMAEREVAVRAQEQERTALEKAELQKKLDDVSTQLADAQRKIVQGSQQLQGEVAELAMEENLRRTFPLDTIEEVKKGARGGDVIQRVVSRTGQPAGILLWETKRAKDWSPAWIGKLKEDMRACGAELGVLVTMPAAVPKEWDPGQPFALHEDVWVTTWPLAIHLAGALRTGLLEVHKQRLASTGKGEKMEAVYDYLTSAQFAQKLKAVYSAFQALQEDLGKERASAEQRFARREKQINTGMKELLSFAGNVQGLAQESLPALELIASDAPSEDT